MVFTEDLPFFNTRPVIPSFDRTSLTGAQEPKGTLSFDRAGEGREEEATILFKYFFLSLGISQTSHGGDII